LKGALSGKLKIRFLPVMRDFFDTDLCEGHIGHPKPPETKKAPSANAKGAFLKSLFQLCF